MFRLAIYLIGAAIFHKIYLHTVRKHIYKNLTKQQIAQEWLRQYRNKHG